MEWQIAYTKRTHAIIGLNFKSQTSHRMLLLDYLREFGVVDKRKNLHKNRFDIAEFIQMHISWWVSFLWSDTRFLFGFIQIFDIIE